MVKAMKDHADKSIYKSEHDDGWLYFAAVCALIFFSESFLAWWIK